MNVDVIDIRTGRVKVMHQRYAEILVKLGKHQYRTAHLVASDQEPEKQAVLVVDAKPQIEPQKAGPDADAEISPRTGKPKRVYKRKKAS